MKWRVAVLLSMATLFMACNRKEAILPPGILPMDTMTMLLADMHLTESALTLNYQQKDSLDLYREIFYETLFLKYRTSEEQFRDSYSYYQQHPDILEEMHDAVITELSKRQGAVPAVP